MKLLPIDLEQIGIAFITACGFAASTWAFRAALASSEQREVLIWSTGGFAVLVLSYIPFFIMLSESMARTIVLTGMMSQMLALALAFAVYGEPMTPARALGLAAALIAVLAFSLPTLGQR